jgi:hypothetical protein
LKITFASAASPVIESKVSYARFRAFTGKCNLLGGIPAAEKTMGADHHGRFYRSGKVKIPGDPDTL